MQSELRVGTRQIEITKNYSVDEEFYKKCQQQVINLILK
jgi:hypothetical protein